MYVFHRITYTKCDEALSYAEFEVKPQTLCTLCLPLISGIVKYEEHLRESEILFYNILFI